MGVFESGLEDVVSGFRKMAEQESDRLLEVATFVGGQLLETARTNAGLTDYSQQDFDNMGNPYSTRFPTNNGPSPDSKVHIQSGLLYQNIQHDIVVTPDTISVTVGVDEGDVPYIGDLIEGTSKMRPRDFLTDTIEEVKDTVLPTLSGMMGGS